MFMLLVILFIIKLYAQNNIFKTNSTIILCISFVLKFTVFNLCLCFTFSQHMYNQILFLYFLNTIETADDFYSSYILHLPLLQHGDIESNPGPKKEQIKYLSCCHWNVNSLLAPNMSKISQIEAYKTL